MEDRLELVKELKAATGVARGLAYRVRSAIEFAYDGGLVDYGEVTDIRSAAARIIAADGNVGYIVRAEEKLARHSQGVDAEANPHQGQD